MGAIDAAFALIQSCMNNNKYADARLYASTLYEIIHHKHDNKIPDDKRQRYIGKGAYHLASATLRLAMSGGIPPEEIQKAGQEAIALARKALEIHTQLYGTEDDKVSNDMSILAEVLDFFNNADELEVLRLFEQSIAIDTRLYGTSSVNVAIGETKLAGAYYKRAKRAHAANELDHMQAVLELTLPHYREAVRIFRTINRMDRADDIAKKVIVVEGMLRQVAIARAAAAAAAPALATKG